MKLIMLLMLNLFSCAQKPVSVSNFEFNFFEKKYTAPVDAEQIKINNKNYTVLEINKNTQLLIDKLGVVVEEIKFDSDKDLDNQYDHIYTPKCAHTSLIKYNLNNKSISLSKNKKLIFTGKSNIILDRLEDDKNQKCLNQWGH